MSNWETEYRRKQRVLERLREAYSSARIYGSRAESLSDRLREIWESGDGRRLRNGDREYLRGYSDALYAEMWHSLRMQQYSTVDHSWHDAFGPEAPTGPEWSRLYGAQCRPSEAGHIDRADTEAYGVGEHYASNAGMPTRYIWPESGPGERPRYHYRPETPESLRVRVYCGDSVVERDWLPGRPS